MMMGRTLLVLAAAASLLAPPPARATPPSGSVRSVRRDLVYVDLGRADGVRAGDVLAVGGSSARLEVVHLGERQLAARRVAGSGGAVVIGARVDSPREPGTTRTTRPVVTLPPPPRPGDLPPPALPWAHEPARRRVLVPGPHAAEPPPRVAPPDGELRVTYVGLLDDSPSDLDLHQAELRSRVTLDLGSGFGYRHDLAARAELGPDLDTRPGKDARPYYRARQLELEWRSPGWSSDPPASRAGAVDAALGRLRLWGDTPGPTLVDGARLDLALGCGWSAGVHGGLTPNLFDTAPSTDRPVFGGHATWVQRGDEWQARATLMTATTFWRGALDRLDVGASGALARGRDLDLYAVVVGTLVDGAPTSRAGATFDLSRAFVGARVRPLAWLTIDSHYAHDAFVLDRETLALLGEDRLVDDPRESARLQLRFDAPPSLSIALSGVLGFGSDVADYQGATLRVSLRELFVPALRAVLGYRVGRSPATDTHSPSVDLTLALDRTAELTLGYGFTTFRSRLLDERQDEHRLDGGVDLLDLGQWRLHLRASYAFGTLPGQVGLLGQLVWRFR